MNRKGATVVFFCLLLSEETHEKEKHHEKNNRLYALQCELELSKTCPKYYRYISEDF